MKNNPYAPLGEQLGQAPTYWRSLEHKEQHASVTETLEVEFPAGITTPEGFNRRDALKLAGASLALGALAGCDALPMRRPEEEILPFVKQPEQLIPGVRQYYATAMPRSEGALGLVVEAHEGRPTKIEGNPNHPSSLGASDIWAQAEVLKLYDPERARSPQNARPGQHLGEVGRLPKDQFGKLARRAGQGPRVPPRGGPGPHLRAAAQGAALRRCREAKVYRWDPLAADRPRVGARAGVRPERPRAPRSSRR